MFSFNILTFHTNSLKEGQVCVLLICLVSENRSVNVKVSHSDPTRTNRLTHLIVLRDPLLLEEPPPEGALLRERIQIITHFSI